jgi:hypothetical protein
LEGLFPEAFGLFPELFGLFPELFGLLPELLGLLPELLGLFPEALGLLSAGLLSVVVTFLFRKLEFFSKPFTESQELFKSNALLFRF